MSACHTGYFRPADAPNAVGVSRSTVYRWNKAGLLKVRKVGGIAFFSVEEVKTIIEGMVEVENTRTM
jgi:predicted site-specific integrase-resolvase